MKTAQGRPEPMKGVSSGITPRFVGDPGSPGADRILVSAHHRVADAAFAVGAFHMPVVAEHAGTNIGERQEWRIRADSSQADIGGVAGLILVRALQIRGADEGTQLPIHGRAIAFVVPGLIQMHRCRRFAPHRRRLQVGRRIAVKKDQQT